MPEPVLATYVAGTWDHLTTIQNDLFMQAMADPAKIACTTFQIMYNNMKLFDLNVDGTYILPIDLSVNPMIYGQGVHIVYDTQHDESTTRASYRPGLAYTSNAMSELQVTGGGEFNENATLVSEVTTRQKAMNKGISLGMAYEIFAKQGYTTAGGVAAEPAGSTTISISDIMQNIMIKAEIKNTPTTVISRFQSIPTIFQVNTGSNSYAGIPLENRWWRVKNFYISGSNEITEITSAADIARFCINAPTDNPGLVTDPLGGLGLGIAWSMRAFDLVFDELQEGGGYELYAGLPPNGYSAILDWQRDNSNVQQNELMTEMGVTKNFRSASYNVTFYSDPTMRYVYPNSMFVYDPETLFYAGVREQCPLIKGWDKVPQTSSIVTAKIMRMQLLTTNPVSCGALHGISWDI